MIVLFFYSLFCIAVTEAMGMHTGRMIQEYRYDIEKPQATICGRAWNYAVSDWWSQRTQRLSRAVALFGYNPRAGILALERGSILQE